MQIIDIASVPNQSFSLTLDGVRWDLVIKQANSSMIMDAYADSVEIVRGQRIVAGTPIIPYSYLQGLGNFLIMTEADELPRWERFDLDQQLIYARFDEIAAIPAAVVSWPAMQPYQSNQPVINDLIIVIGS